jgi:hypothetical protein
LSFTTVDHDSVGAEVKSNRAPLAVTLGR